MMWIIIRKYENKWRNNKKIMMIMNNEEKMK